MSILWFLLGKKYGEAKSKNNKRALIIFILKLVIAISFFSLLINAFLGQIVIAIITLSILVITSIYLKKINN